MITKEIANNIYTEILKYNNILIIPHRNPDGDALGASLGLYHTLNKIGKSVSILSPSDCPSYLDWMPGFNSIIDFLKETEIGEKLINKSDLLIFLDFNDLKRTDSLCDYLENKSCKKIMIDHHPYPKNIAELSISIPAASSTCEIVCNVIDKSELNKYWTTSAAECLYTGIMTDTGNLSYNSSNPETYITIANLLKHNVDKDYIQRMVFNNNSFDRIKLLGHVLNNKLIIDKNTEVGYFWLDRDELDSFNYKPGDTEGFVNYPLSISGINASAFFMVDKDNKVKCSFRSRGDLAINTFASNFFNGGGHKNAAGGSSEYSLEETIKRFEKLWKANFNLIKNNKEPNINI